MDNADASTAFVNILSVLFGALGGIIVAILNNSFERARRKAEIEKLEAETKKLKAETNILNAQAGSLESKAASIEDRQEALEFIIKYFVPWPEIYFLEKLVFAGDRDFVEFEDKFRDKEHLRGLRDQGFIEKIGQKNISDLNHGDNLRQFFKGTESGNKYLEYLKRLNRR